MNFLDRFFRRTRPTANIAQGRLQEVLTHERTLALPTVQSDPVAFKQAEDGLCILLAEGAWPDLMDNLTVQLESPAMRDFFDGARVKVESGSRTLTADELEELSLVLARHNMVLNLRREDAGDGDAAFHHNVPLVPPEALHTEIAYASAPASADGDNWLANQSILRDPVLLIRHSIVAGQVIHYGGTIVIFGDVSPAAEVIAERDVIVFGKLRGIVQAGASGNNDAIIAALLLTPAQARIGE
ncbi:MAG TPA: septum site-determining protein MinC, partial [Armatimonadota bacterium]|nr:septum site-determining protein MinC [Armatimonadota bacterium]